jgi:hypothetical protein
MAGVFPKGSVPTWPRGERWGTPAVNPPGPSVRTYLLYLLAPLCCRVRVPSRPVSFRPACTPKPQGRLPAMSGCTRSNTDGSRVKLYSRPGNDLTDRFPLIVEALAGLRSRSCIIDGEAVACDDRGIASSHPPPPQR